jgi:hypothetical protein
VPAVYGDSADGTGQVLAHLDQSGITAMTKVPPLHAPGGRFAKDRFTIDLADRTVTCPARRTVAITPRSGGGGLARCGLLRVGQDFRLLAAAVNLARLATLGIGYRSSGWAVAPA